MFSLGNTVYSKALSSHSFSSSHLLLHPLSGSSLECLVWGEFSAQPVYMKTSISTCDASRELQGPCPALASHLHLKCTNILHSTCLQSAPLSPKIYLSPSSGLFYCFSMLIRLETMIGIQSTDTGARLPGVKSWFCHFPFPCPREVINLSIYEVGVT